MLTIPIGTRVDLHGLTLIKLTSYDRKIFDEAPASLYWRHLFVDNSRNLIVYSGKRLGVKLNEVVSIRATIKKHEETYKCTRLARPILIEPQKQEELKI